MAVSAWVGQGAITLKVGSTQYETSITGVREVLSSTGGQEIELADASVLRTVEVATVTQVEVDCVQSLTSTDLFRYLRENASTTATLYITGTSSTTEGTSNPKWTYSVTGWKFPPLEFNPGSSATPTAVFTVSGNPTVDVTP